MRRLILGLLLGISLLQCGEVTDSMSGVHAKIFPQLLTFSKTFEQTSTITVAIIYGSNYEEDAERFRELIAKNFGGQLKQKKFDTIILPEVSAMHSTHSFQAAYILSDTPSTKALLTNLHKKSIITFAGTESAIGYGALLGMRSGDKMQLLLNKQAYQSGKFNFNQSLIRMVKIYEEN